MRQIRQEFRAKTNSNKKRDEEQEKPDTISIEDWSKVFRKLKSDVADMIRRAEKRASRPLRFYQRAQITTQTLVFLQALPCDDCSIETFNPNEPSISSTPGFIEFPGRNLMIDSATKRLLDDYLVKIRPKLVEKAEQMPAHSVCTIYSGE